MTNNLYVLDYVMKICQIIFYSIPESQLELVTQPQKTKETQKPLQLENISQTGKSKEMQVSLSSDKVSQKENTEKIQNSVIIEKF